MFVCQCAREREIERDRERHGRDMTINERMSERVNEGVRLYDLVNGRVHELIERERERER